MSLQYASLEEAWGTPAHPVRRRRRTKDARVPGPGSGEEPHAWADLEGGGAQSYAPYEKEAGQRSDQPLPGLFGPGRRHPAEAVLEPGPGEPVRTPAEYRAPRPYAPPGAEPGAGPAAEAGAGRPLLMDRGDAAFPEPAAWPTAPHADRREAGGVYDVALYVFGGVVLILLLEQFVQMGVALGARRAFQYP